MYYSTVDFVVTFVEESDFDNFLFELISCNPEVPELVGTLSDLTNNIRTVMKRFKDGKLRDELQEIIKRSSSIELCVQIDVKTHWNSMLYILEKFLKLFDFIRIHYSEKG